MLQIANADEHRMARVWQRIWKFVCKPKYEYVSNKQQKEDADMNVIRSESGRDDFVVHLAPISVHSDNVALTV